MAMAGAEERPPPSGVHTSETLPAPLGLCLRRQQDPGLAVVAEAIWDIHKPYDVPSGTDAVTRPEMFWSCQTPDMLRHKLLFGLSPRLAAMPDARSSYSPPNRPVPSCMNCPPSAFQFPTQSVRLQYPYSPHLLIPSDRHDVARVRRRRLERIAPLSCNTNPRSCPPITCQPDHGDPMSGTPLPGLYFLDNRVP
jgi:hypothetical protein